MEVKNWPHRKYEVKMIEVKEHQEQTIQAYTDGSKDEHRVASRVAIFVGRKLAVQLKLKLDDRCSNIQAEQLAIFKAVQVISRKTDKKKKKKNTK
jgi:ribonuclease HI